jgi:hypothetical protein
MIKYILTDKQLNIIDQRYEAWKTPGEYDANIFNIVVCECAINQKVVAVTSLGNSEHEVLQGHNATVYKNAVVEYENIPMPGEVI